MPSTVNNLETIAIVPTALEMGGEAFSKLSAIHDLKDGGTRLFGVSGHVKTPGVFEAAVGLTLRELVYDLGGGVEHGELLGVIPGGSSCPILRPEETVNAPDAKSPAPPLARQERARRAHGRRHVPRARHDARHLLRHRAVATRPTRCSPSTT
jgi:NADH-quinone oxidoreductase subunit F